jgi:hypothetical protein
MAESTDDERRPGMPRRVIAAGGAVLAACLLAAAPAGAKDTAVVYTAIENEQIAEYKKAIEKSLPNLDLKILRLSTGDISARFMAEKDNMQADVIWGVGANPNDFDCRPRTASGS